MSVSLDIALQSSSYHMAMEIAATSKPCSADSTNMFCVSCMADHVPLQEPLCAEFFLAIHA